MQAENEEPFVQNLFEISRPNKSREEGLCACVGAVSTGPVPGALHSPGLVSMGFWPNEVLLDTRRNLKHDWA